MAGVKREMVKMEKKVSRKLVITKSMTIGEILRKKPAAAEILMAAGMGCVYCPAASMETLEQGACAHSIDVKKLLKELNK